MNKKEPLPTFVISDNTASRGINEIELTVYNNMGFDTEMEIFHPLKDHDKNLNNLLLNGLISGPGINQSLVAGNTFGTRYYDVNGSQMTINPANTGNAFISSTKYPYNQLLNWLRTESIYITKVKIDCVNTEQLKKEWKLRKYYPNGRVYEMPIDNSNIISPEQVQPTVAVFYLNSVITKYTGIAIQMINAASLKINMEFNQLKETKSSELFTAN